MDSPDEKQHLVASTPYAFDFLFYLFHLVDLFIFFLSDRSIPTAIKRVVRKQKRRGRSWRAQFGTSFVVTGGGSSSFTPQAGQSQDGLQNYSPILPPKVVHSWPVILLQCVELAPSPTLGLPARPTGIRLKRTNTGAADMAINSHPSAQAATAVQTDNQYNNRYHPSGFSGYFRMTEKNIVNHSGLRLDLFNRWSLDKKLVGGNYYTLFIYCNFSITFNGCIQFPCDLEFYQFDQFHCNGNKLAISQYGGSGSIHVWHPGPSRGRFANTASKGGPFLTRHPFPSDVSDWQDTWIRYQGRTSHLMCSII